MKLTDLSILFVIIVLPFILILRIKSENLQNAAYKSEVINRYLDAAVEDASEAMIIRGVDKEIEISCENAVNTFFNTLFINFNVGGDERAKSLLSAYIPVIVLIDYDGYFVMSMEEYTNSKGEAEQKMIWKPKKPYVYESGGFIYLFTLEQKVTVYSSSSKRFYEGLPEDIKVNLPAADVLENGLFDDVRKRTIVESIKNDVNAAINKHNKYAVRFGITYNFSPPSISDGDWQRNIEDVGFLAFFQGLPIGLNGQRYNSFALGAARIVRKSIYYIEKGANDLFYYHRDKCQVLTERNKPYDSREECALDGAFPCPVCSP
ncbi:MAG TPA: hypothetical protein VIL89_02545 [Clostridia bacterium]